MSTERETLELPIGGMDCASCVTSLEKAIRGLPGVWSVEVLLGAEKAVVQLDPAKVGREEIRKAVRQAGYTVPEEPSHQGEPPAAARIDLSRSLLTVLGLVFGTVLFVVVIGEWLGLFKAVTRWVPFPVGLALVLAFGYPIFRGVVQATLRRKVTSHTLMSVGVLAALVIGQWATAAVVVFFMRLGDYVEKLTAGNARKAVRQLTQQAPQKARVLRNGLEMELSVGEVVPGDIVVVRPGEAIPVDGEVVAGQATVDQAAITGESMPVEAVPGSRVYAATLTQLGALKIKATQVGRDTTFGRIIKLVEEAEANRGEMQRMADRFSGYFLPAVALIAAITFLLSHNVLATAAVLLVACSCSIALATPVAVLATTGAAARRGLLIKGGKYLEAIAKADVLLVDKTGTLTLGRPQLTDVVSLGAFPKTELLKLTASAERYSEHPLAQAVRQAAEERSITLLEPKDFESVPGQGVRATVDGRAVVVGSRRMAPVEGYDTAELEAQGKTLLFVTIDAQLAGILAAADTLRPEVPEALKKVLSLGVNKVELLTGDNEPTAAALAKSLGVSYRANLLPEDKIAIVKDYQTQGHTVVMVGDGVNDAPALAQADAGMAMGAAGTSVAVEAAAVALLREDWSLVPQAFEMARRTMGVVRMNLGLTALYNLVGLTLAALGFLPPVLAAALQSIPDLGIMANSSRLIRQR